jgi:small redox-active disulfide protein 2
MAEKSIVQILINGRPIGIVGLTEAIADLAKTHADQPDDVVTKELMSRLAAVNYVPEKAKPAYGKAVLREFYKYLGKPVEEEPATGIRVTILGPGCAQCSRVESDVLEVMAEMALPADFTHVTDVKEIASYGLIAVPAVAINGKVVSSGVVPPKSWIRQWLQEVKDKNPS